MTAPLVDTYWKLVALENRPARDVEGLGEPHLRLDPAQARASGSTGCNSYSGPYRLTGDSLRVGPLISTRRACIDTEMNAQEAVFLAALDATRTWRIARDTLVLAGEAGPLARFAASEAPGR